MQASINFKAKNKLIKNTKIKIINKNYARISSNNDYEKISSSGDFVQIGSSGDSTQISSSGDSAKISSSGNFTKIGSSGDFAKIGSSGHFTRITSEGKYSVICCAGPGSIARGKIGSWITLSEWQYDEEKQVHLPICVKTEFIDGEKIKEDTFYKLENGNFVEVE